MTALSADQFADLRGDLGISNAVQRVKLTGGPTGGTFTLSYDGQATGNIPYNAAAGALQAALEALATIGADNVEVTGNVGGVWTVTFGGVFAGVSLGLLTGNGALLSGGTTPAVAVAVDTVFSDSELQRFYTRAGDDYDKAVVYGLRDILMRAAKFYSYTVGQTSHQKQQIREGLEKMLDRWERIAGLSGGKLSAGEIDLGLDEEEVVT